MPFSSIIGHDRPVAILKRALANDAVAHAYLFSGEPGIGKRLTALEFAAALNCQTPGPDGGCGVCAACSRIPAGSHPDVRTIAPDGDEIKIDQIRQAQADLSLRPFEGRRKVLIIDGAEAMNEASSNAFLKTLEEPPGDSLIILITAMPQSLLATIRSRSQELKFQPLPRGVLAGVFKERRGLGDEDAWFAAALSRGSIGRALDMDVAEERTVREQYRALTAGLAGMQDEEVLAVAEGVAKDRDGFVRLIDIGIERLRDEAVLSITGNERLLVYGAAGQGTFPLPKLLRTMDLLTESRQLLDRRVSAQLVAERLFFRLARS